MAWRMMIEMFSQMNRAESIKAPKINSKAKSNYSFDDDFIVTFSQDNASRIIGFRVVLLVWSKLIALGTFSSQYQPQKSALEK
jgi:hypothetical protein